MSPSLRAMKSEQVQFSLRSSGTYRSNQGALWHEIAEKAARRGAASPGMAMAEIYEKDRPSTREYLSHFSLVGSQVGAVFMINGKVVGMDAFGKPETFSKVFRKLIESYALDAVDWFEPEKEHKVLKSQVTGFLKASLATEVETHPGVGAGTDYRLSSKKMTGFALISDDWVLHLSIFARINENSPKSRIARFSRRARFRM